MLRAKTVKVFQDVLSLLKEAIPSQTVSRTVLSVVVNANVKTQWLSLLMLSLNVQLIL